MPADMLHLLQQLQQGTFCSIQLNSSSPCFFTGHLNSAFTKGLWHFSFFSFFFQITGGSQGTGRALALKCTAAGYNVILCSRSPAALEEAGNLAAQASSKGKSPAILAVSGGGCHALMWFTARPLKKCCALHQLSRPVLTPVASDGCNVVCQGSLVESNEKGRRPYLLIPISIG